MTLAAALAQAAADPRDNAIEFDPALFRAGPAVFRLTRAIALQSARSGQDRLDGPAGDQRVIIDASQCADAAVIVGGSVHLTASHVAFRGGGKRVLLLTDSADVSLEQTTVGGGSMPGIALFGQAHLAMRDCELNGNRTHGLELRGHSSARLEHVRLSGNGQSGAAAFENSTLSALDCGFTENGEWGVVLADVARAKLERCTVSQCRFANADVSNASQLECRECTFQQGQRFGLFATGTAQLILAESRVIGGGGRGVELQDRATIRLQGCRLESHADYGLILFGSARAVASETTFARNAAHGVSLRDESTGEFRACTFTGNRYSGIGCLDGHDGGAVLVSRCVFQGNGMRPIYRGPLHLDPLVPTPLRIEGRTVECLADPGASIELYLDHAGEASRFLKTIRAGRDGRFRVDGGAAPDGYVITAAATVGGATSEFNVVAGTVVAPVLDALLARTGPLSDEGGGIRLESPLRRWKPGTRLLLDVEGCPSHAVETYLQFLSERINDWTRGSVTAQVQAGASKARKADVVIPLQYVSADAARLAGRGGVTFMRWDSSGYFLSPMEILLALGREPQESCPRVAAHEIGHALGLSHARVGLLSRMQGSVPPNRSFVNDFSPTMTFYDVLALQSLYDPANPTSLTLQHLLDRGTIRQAYGAEIAARQLSSAEPSFSPPPTDADVSQSSNRTTQH